MSTGRIMIAVVTAALVAACGPGGDAALEDGREEVQTDGQARGMSGVGMGGSDAMMDDMTAHMSMMSAMRGDSLMAALPAHRQVTANMIARMNREMQDMNMPADAAWTMTVDSLREDLVRMPEMDAAELEAMMPEHRGRAMRLIEMHRRMTTDMGM